MQAYQCKKRKKRRRNLDYGTERSLAKWSVKHQELQYIQDSIKTTDDICHWRRVRKEVRVFTTEGKYFGLKRLEVIGSFLVIETLKYIQTVVK